MEVLTNCCNACSALTSKRFKESNYWIRDVKAAFIGQEKLQQHFCTNFQQLFSDNVQIRYVNKTDW